LIDFVEIIGLFDLLVPYFNDIVFLMD